MRDNQPRRDVTVAWLLLLVAGHDNLGLRLF
jgi:hypothetical protein